MLSLNIFVENELAKTKYCSRCWKFYNNRSYIDRASQGMQWVLISICSYAQEDTSLVQYWARDFLYCHLGKAFDFQFSS